MAICCWLWMDLRVCMMSIDGSESKETPQCRGSRAPSDRHHRSSKVWQCSDPILYDTLLIVSVAYNRMQNCMDHILSWQPTYSYDVTVLNTWIWRQCSETSFNRPSSVQSLLIKHSKLSGRLMPEKSCLFCKAKWTMSRHGHAIVPMQGQYNYSYRPYTTFQEWQWFFYRVCILRLFITFLSYYSFRVTLCTKRTYMQLLATPVQPLACIRVVTYRRASAER